VLRQQAGREHARRTAILDDADIQRLAGHLLGAPEVLEAAPLARALEIQAGERRPVQRGSRITLDPRLVKGDLLLRQLRVRDPRQEAVRELGALLLRIRLRIGADYRLIVPQIPTAESAPPPAPSIFSGSSNTMEIVFAPAKMFTGSQLVSNGSVSPQNAVGIRSSVATFVRKVAGRLSGRI
jgi:hypothetical protein